MEYKQQLSIYAFHKLPKNIYYNNRKKNEKKKETGNILVGKKPTHFPITNRRKEDEKLLSIQTSEKVHIKCTKFIKNVQKAPNIFNNEMNIKKMENQIEKYQKYSIKIKITKYKNL